MNEKWWLHFAGLATKRGIDSVGPKAANYCLVPQTPKDGVSAEPHQQVGDGAGQNYP